MFTPVQNLPLQLTVIFSDKLTSSRSPQVPTHCQTIIDALNAMFADPAATRAEIFVNLSTPKFSAAPYATEVTLLIFDTGAGFLVQHIIATGDRGREIEGYISNKITPVRANI